MSPVPEPASAALRRLHEEASGVGVSRHDPDVYGILRDADTARATLANAIPALADLVAAVERHNGRCPYLQCALCIALAALRERLEARP